MNNWTGEPLPERPLKWTAFDYAVIIAAFVILAVVGIVSAGGPP